MPKKRSKKKTQKKRRQPKAPTTWNKVVARVRRANPKLEFKDAVKLASRQYNNKSGKKTAKRKVRTQYSRDYSDSDIEDTYGQNCRCCGGAGKM